MARGHSIRSALSGHAAHPEHAAAGARYRSPFGPECREPWTEEDWEDLEAHLSRLYEFLPVDQREAQLRNYRWEAEDREPGEISVVFECMAEDVANLLGYPYVSTGRPVFEACHACGEKVTAQFGDVPDAAFGPAGEFYHWECLPPEDYAHERGFVRTVHDPVRWMLAALQRHAAGHGPHHPATARAQKLRTFLA